MGAGGELWPRKLVILERPDRKSLIQSWIWWGMSRREIFERREPVRTVSNALEKSRAMTRTKGSEERMLEMVCKRVIIAAVVEPDGLKANWEERDNGAGMGCRKAG